MDYWVQTKTYIVTDRSVVKKREGERSTAKGNGELLAMIEIS